MIDRATIEANREKWLTALESGEYKQTESVLEDSTGFCCLGVACKVIAPELRVIDTGDEPDADFIRYEGEQHSLPIAVQEALDMRSTDGAIDWTLASEDDEDGDNPCSLANANDDHDWDFQKIAGFIRRNPLTVFNPPPEAA